MPFATPIVENKVSLCEPPVTPLRLPSERVVLLGMFTALNVAKLLVQVSVDWSIAASPDEAKSLLLPDTSFPKVPLSSKSK